MKYLRDILIILPINLQYLNLDFYDNNLGENVKNMEYLEEGLI